MQITVSVEPRAILTSLGQGESVHNIGWSLVGQVTTGRTSRFIAEQALDWSAGIDAVGFIKATVDSAKAQGRGRRLPKPFTITYHANGRAVVRTATGREVTWREGSAVGAYEAD